MPSSTRWVESLSPWPADGFGTERMRALLGELGDPQKRFPAIHVVGTNGKSTTTRLTEALLLDAGLSVGSYLSPHVRGWSERIRVGGEEADFEAVVRPQRDGQRGGQGDVEAEHDRLQKEVERSERMLANEKFVANAAPEVVEGERQKLEQYRVELEALGG